VCRQTPSLTDNVFVTFCTQLLDGGCGVEHTGKQSISCLLRWMALAVVLH
jgi:hypothetical protein